MGQKDFADAYSQSRQAFREKNLSGFRQTGIEKNALRERREIVLRSC